MAMKHNDKLDISSFLRFDLSERMKRRSELSKEILGEIYSKTHIEREKYFFNEVVNYEEVWTLWDGEELPEFQTEEGSWVLHVWPHKQFVQIYDAPSIASPQIIPIPIDAWVNDILFNSADDISVSVFPSNSIPVSVMRKEEFIERIYSEFVKVNIPGDINLTTHEIVKLLEKGNMAAKPKGKLP